jgi:hypothetical protein
VAAALALVRCELERERLARETIHLARRTAGADAAFAKADALARQLRDRLAPQTAHVRSARRSEGGDPT